MSPKTAENNLLMKRAGYASLTVALVLIILKILTFLITGSVAILSSLFDSVQDIMTSGVNMIAVRQAAEPADNDHRFGHGKAQAIGSFIQAFIMAGSSFFLLYESIERFCHPKGLNQITLGLIITVVAIILTFFLVRYQTMVIRQTNSLSVKADRAHYSGDILMNVGVIISMLVTYLTGWNRLDSIFGMIVSGYLLIAVYQILKDSFNMLMDTEMPESFRNDIKKIVHAFPEICTIHDLRTRQSGCHAFVQFCAHMDDSLTLRQAHDITDKIEDRIREKFPDTEVIIHPEPERKRS